MEEMPVASFVRAPGVIMERVNRGAHVLLTRYGRPFVLLSPPPPPDKPGDETSPE